MMNNTLLSTNSSVNPVPLALTGERSEPTMSSKEIAELVQAQHGNVKICIERLEDRELITFFAMQEKSTGGRPAEVYHVNQRDSYLVVAQLSPEFTARLVDRWRELEAMQPQLPNFNDPAIAARAWADEVEQKQKLEAQAQLDAPKVAFVDNVLEQSEGLMTLGDFGRILKDDGLPTGARKIFAQLRELGHLLRNKPIPYSYLVERGYFVIGEKVTARRTDPVALVTGAGQRWIYEQLMQLLN